MDFHDLLLDSFGRIRDILHRTLDGLTADQMSFRPDTEANSIAWLAWHLTRIQDDHVSELAESEQIWTAQGWADRFALPFPRTATGYGHRPAEVAAVQGDAPLLLGYYDAVHAATVTYVTRVTEKDLERVVDDSWDPPVSLGVRLISVVCDDLQHVGQAAYVRGLAERR
jgi:hypothetical protein